MDEWIKLFREVGFPVAVAAFVLFRLERAMHELVNVVQQLATLIARHEASAQEIMTALRELLRRSP